MVTPLETSPSPVIPGDWATAPKIVKGWAWVLSILGALFLPFIMFVPFFGRIGVGIGSVPMVLTGLLWLLDLFLVYAIRYGVRLGWYVQIGVSVLKLRYLPFGTLLHAQLLSQWFKPEVKAWFGVR